MRKINIIFFALFVLIGTSRFYGQSPQSKITAGAPAGSYKLGGFDDVNLFSGNLNFNLPLVNTNGRGESSVGLSLSIENQWSISPTGTTLGGAHSFNIRSNQVAKVNGAGYLKITGSRNITNEDCGTQGTPSYWIGHQLALSFVEPNGTEHRLVDPQSLGNEKLVCDSLSYGFGDFFQSTDGTSITFISDSPIGSTDTSLIEGVGATGFVYFNNGSVFRIENGEILWIKDRNGNKTEITYDPTSYLHFPLNIPRPIKIKDSVNREITIQYDVNEPSPYGLCHKVTYKGFSGQDRVIRLSVGQSLRSPKANTDDELNLASMISTNPNDSPFFTGSNLYDSSQSIKAIWLPDGRSYNFEYNVNGRLAKVNLPSGGKIEYDFYQSTAPSPLQWDVFINRLKEKRLYDENNVLQNRTVFSCASSPCSGDQITVETYDSANVLLEKSRHYFHGDALFSPNIGNAGKEYKTENFASDGTTILTRIERNWQNILPLNCYVNTPVYNPCVLTYPRNPNFSYVDVETKTTLVESNLVSLVTSKNPIDQTIAYDRFNNKTDTWEYDYGIGQPGVFKRRTHTDYLTDGNYLNSYLRSLPSQTWVSSDIAGTNKVSLSQIEYDNYAENSLFPRANIFGHDTANFGTSKTIRGNVTKVTTYSDVNDSNTAISVKSRYDILGNVVATIDAKGCSTTIEYADRFGSPDSEARSNSAPPQLGGLSAFAFPTSSTNCAGWIVGHSQFDYFTGQPVNSEDLNGVISKTIYNDLLDRPTQSVMAIGTPHEMQSNIIYDDANRRVESKSDLFALNDNLSKSESFYDGLGRTFEVRKYESDGGYIKTNTEFDALSRPKRATNPYRPLKGETPVWTETFYDSLGRSIKTKTSDNAEVLTSYLGNTVTVTDQAGKKRRSVTNALGQLTRVDEPNDVGQLDVNGVPAQSTNYEYDTLNNLITVNQGVQTRTFQYDSLSRLKQANNPESGLISYTYDVNGNLKTKRDARGIKTIYDYDNLNRVSDRCYRIVGTGSLGSATCIANNETIEPNTPAVAYTYDNLPNAKGKLIKVANGISETRYLAFDILGRVTSDQQMTDGVTYNPQSYLYNLSGALIEQTYPSGRVVKNTLDQDGDLQQVQSRKSSGTFQNYANAFTYTSAGAVSSLRLGNGKFENTTFNSRLQPIQIGLGSSATSQNLLKLNYEYGTTVFANNGNITQQTITVPTEIRNNIPYNGFIATQNYTYDSLNRLKSAEETIPNQLGWKQTFKYDRYGNREFDTQNNNTNTLANGCPVAVCNPSANPNDNKLVGTNYDVVGNTTIDANGQTFTYDADNKQTKVVNAQGVTLGEYFYDGDGKRVKKVAPLTNETTIFVYDASGKMVAEYSTVSTSQSEAKISYLTNDHLGSPRITTDATGKVISRRDFMPFGEEVERASYGTDNVREEFATYERDGETGLDYAQARMFGSDLGRFTSPDPILLSVSGQNPQTWNRYAYVMNNPLNFTDPLGLWAIDFEYIWKQKDGKDVYDKKGKKVLAGIFITFRKSKKDGDDGASLAKQLGLTGKDATEFAKVVGNADYVPVGEFINSKSFRTKENKQLLNEISEVFTRVANRLTAEYNSDRKNSGPTDAEEANCAGTADALAGGTNGLRIQPGDFDKILKSEYEAKDEQNLRIRDVIRYATDGGKTPKHFTTFLFKQDDGTPYVFSKSGDRGIYEHGTASRFQSTGYGNISGFYHRK